MDELSHLKFIDFSQNKVLEKINDLINEEVGTLYYYMAPKVILGNDNEKWDIWLCPVILYIIISGNPPFYAKKRESLRRKIYNIEYNFDFPSFIDQQFLIIWISHG